MTFNISLTDESPTCQRAEYDSSGHRLRTLRCYRTPQRGP